MSHLMIDDEARAKAAELITYAEAHPYLADDPAAAAPGGDPGHVATFGSFRVVFSFTEKQGVRFRQLSVSVPNRRPGTYPDPIMVFEIAALLGFTGWNSEPDTIPRMPEGWSCKPIPEDRCVSVIQPIGATAPRGRMS